ncbi:hypothetical protein ACH5RR_010300 [Cinchona calisaya]|uniref:Uncharacterized protein n=1 Tax=Cinchona calisaya TaxID=153742 RepID=A0ABD3AHT7_9GENT
MGDLAKIAKARADLEELYSGIPDDSVNLTFGDLAEVRPQSVHSSNEKKTPPLDTITKASPRKEEVAPLTKLPSLDFSRGLEASARSDHHIHYQSRHLPHMHHLSHNRDTYNSTPISNHNNNLDLQHDHQAAGGKHNAHYGHDLHHHHHHGIANASPYSQQQHHGVQLQNNSSMVYDDMSQMSGYPGERCGRRRPGIPHSKICTVCSTYIYIFRHRCLVCGRVYCRQCVGIGMGQMTEGRKCIECLGRRFSQRYIKKAGQIGCCMGYPSIVKQQELKWAEKGPKGSGENRYGRSGIPMVSISRNPAPRTPSTRGHNNNNPPSFVSNNSPSSFVMGSPYSPYYSSTNHPLPF